MLNEVAEKVTTCSAPLLLFIATAKPVLASIVPLSFAVQPEPEKSSILELARSAPSYTRNLILSFITAAAPPTCMLPLSTVIANGSDMNAHSSAFTVRFMLIWSAVIEPPSLIDISGVVASAATSMLSVCAVTVFAPIDHTGAAAVASSAFTVTVKYAASPVSASSAVTSLSSVGTGASASNTALTSISSLAAN